VVANHPNDFKLIRYHVWWPSSGDPFYQHNTADVQTRNNYFGNNYTPHFYCDGTDRGSNYGLWESQVTNRATVDSPIEISINGEWNAMTRQVQVTTTVNIIGTVPSSNLRIFYGLTEDSLYYGSKYWNQTFRDFISPASGTPVSFNQNGTYVYTSTFTLNSIYVPSHVEFFFFVENYSTKEILQGSKHFVPTLEPFTVAIGMTPNNNPVNVPAGGFFLFTGTLENNTPNPQTADVWIMIDVPGIGMFGPISQFNNVVLAPNQAISVPGVRQDIPFYAPTGAYNYIAHCGDYPATIISSATFPFTVFAPKMDGGNDNWNISGWFEDGNYIPSSSSLVSNYPNPFNATTQITFNLPEQSKVALEIYDLLGRRVDSVPERVYTAGQHSISWDASQFASGVYFYKLIAGDEVITSRMTLLK